MNYSTSQEELSSSCCTAGNNICSYLSIPVEVRVWATIKTANASREIQKTFVHDVAHGVTYMSRNFRKVRNCGLQTAKVLHITRLRVLIFGKTARLLEAHQIIKYQTPPMQIDHGDYDMRIDDREVQSTE